ncbi:membrane protein [Vibrio caribbeanicus]|uniref:Membrane protein n=2 Tax=Vibrio TaxID=662 RepID=A0A0A5HRX7_PHOS4|nr:membrane protein [Vibrio sinaloensis]KHD23075.1 membrane protein [Vibrio caribbeanicus]KHT48265.1 membrane protein [Vibrio sinaloensis]KIE22714.1 membrane protein [Vibrio sinaloensis]
MFIVYRLIKLAVICAVFFTLYDLIAFGEITWVSRLIAQF